METGVRLVTGPAGTVGAASEPVVKRDRYLMKSPAISRVVSRQPCIPKLIMAFGGPGSSDGLRRVAPGPKATVIVATPGVICPARRPPGSAPDQGCGAQSPAHRLPRRLLPPAPPEAVAWSVAAIVSVAP